MFIISAISYAKYVTDFIYVPLPTELWKSQMGDISQNISLIISTYYFISIMNKKTIREIAEAWKEYKRPYVKQSTMAAYVLILENHVLPEFGDNNSLHEHDVQAFVLKKIEHGLSVKSVKDILIVLKMVMKFGVKNEWMNHYEWDIKYPANSQSKELEVLSVANHKRYWTMCSTTSPL